MNNFIFIRLLFWANESHIHAITLSGLIFEPVCCTTDTSPFGFTVDTNRRRLYWLNNHADDGHIVVNQLEYSSTSCDLTRYLHTLYIITHKIFIVPLINVCYTALLSKILLNCHLGEYSCMYIPYHLQLGIL